MFLQLAAGKCFDPSYFVTTLPAPRFLDLLQPLILMRLQKVFEPIVSFRFLGISTCLEFLNGLTFFSARSTSEPSPHVRRLLSVTFCKRFWKDKIKGLHILCCWSPMRQIRGFQDLDLVRLRKGFFFMPLLQSKSHCAAMQFKWVYSGLAFWGNFISK